MLALRRKIPRENGMKAPSGAVSQTDRGAGGGDVAA